MATLATSLSKALPKPKYTGEHEELPAHAQPKGTRIVGANSLDESQIVLKVSFSQHDRYVLTGSQRAGPPPYGKRTGWRPRSAEDYGDGGAFPEIPVAQYPLDMGRGKSSSSNALALRVDGEGK